jgi:hypothetical protein
MIDRYSNNVAITSQDQLQLMDRWEDCPIKVLDMAPLIMVTLLTLSSSFSTCGCFLQVERSFSEDSLLSLACGWPLGVNGSLYCEWQRLHELRVEDPSGARKGGLNRPPECARKAPPLALFWRCHPRVQDGGSPCMKSGLLRFNPQGCSFATLWSLPPSEATSSSS